MRTLLTLTSFLVVSLLGIACSGDLPTGVDATSLTPSAQFSAQAGNPVVLAVRGSGHFTSSVLPEEDAWRNISFNANKRADGSVTGEIQLKNRETGVTYHGDMICAAYVEGSDPPVYALAASDERVVGDGGAAMGEVVWAVRDNGQGANADPDQITFWAWFPAGVGTYLCENLAAFYTMAEVEALLIPVEAGDISVETSD
ncbi:MAG: hypothetical protein P8Y10_11300 [Gemmatimonadales bacterium]